MSKIVQQITLAGWYNYDSNNTNTTYKDVGDAFGSGNTVGSSKILWTSANHPGATIYFEAIIGNNDSTDGVYAQLYDLTGAAAVTDSTVSSSSSNPERLRSAALTLTDGREYSAWGKVLASTDDSIFYEARVVVYYNDADFSNFESYIQLHGGGAFSNGTTSYIYSRVNMPRGGSFYYDSANWDGSPAIYFEGTLKATSPYTAYGVLRNYTDSSDVASSEVSTASTTSVRVRSGSLTLTTAKDHTCGVKSSNALGGAYLYGAFVIISQTSPTKMELHHQTRSGSRTGWTQTTYTHEWSVIYYDPATWDVTGVGAYTEIYHYAGASETVYHHLADSTQTEISGSEISTTANYPGVRQRSGDFWSNMPVAAGIIYTGFKCSPGTNNNTRMYGGKLIFVVTDTGTGAGVPEIEQEGFRFRDDDNNEASATWLAAQDTDVTRADGTNTRLRILLNATNNPATSQFQLEYKLSADGAAEWRAVPES